MVYAHDITPLLNRCGLRQIDVARAMGVEKSTVSRWVTGRVPVERLADLANLIGVSPAVIRPDLAGILNPNALPGQTGEGN